MFKLVRPKNTYKHGHNGEFGNVCRAITPFINNSVLFRDEEGLLYVDTILSYKNKCYQALFLCIDRDIYQVKEFEKIEWFFGCYDRLENGSRDLLWDAKKKVNTILSNKFFYNLYESII